MPKTFAAFSVSRSPGGPITLVGLTRTETRAMRGNACWSNSNLFGFSSDARRSKPVTLPPGWAMFFTNPSATGSPFRCSHHDRDSARGVESGLGGAGGIGNDYIGGNANQFR